MRVLPTWVSRTNTYAAFAECLIDELHTDTSSRRLSLYFYAITRNGWDRIRPALGAWRNRQARQAVRVYCGTDHCATEPSALEAILREPGTRGFLVRPGRSTFHPKAVVLEGSAGAVCYVGSNNLTGAGLDSNYELAARVTLSPQDYRLPGGLRAWQEAVADQSIAATQALIRVYQDEYKAARRLPQDRRAASPRRASLRGPAATAFPRPASAVLEVMPRETGTRGTQLQVPLEVARLFFGLRAGGRVPVSLLDEATGQHTALTLTDYGNSTRRLSISQLADARPAVVWFSRTNGEYRLHVVGQRTDPDEYARLLSLCVYRRSPHSKRWVMLEDAQP